ncbi:COesterase domain containing protein, partial [Asbolus verrucosus]
PPLQPESGDGIRDTVGRNVSCYQQSADGDCESEDCLFANIFTTKLSPIDGDGTTLPVMFFMHGEGFDGGSNMWEEPEIFSTMGLSWSQLTPSAGSASVTYHLLNREVEGLIQGGICESETYLSPWSFQRRARETAFATAAILNDTFLANNNSQDQLELLQNVPAKALDIASDKYHDRVSCETSTNTNYDCVKAGNSTKLEASQGFYWGLVIELKDEDALITKKMHGLLKIPPFDLVQFGGDAFY